MGIDPKLIPGKLMWSYNMVNVRITTAILARFWEFVKRVVSESQGANENTPPMLSGSERTVAGQVEYD